MRNLGSLGFVLASALLVGHALSSGVPALVLAAWRIVGFAASLLIGAGVFVFVGEQTESALSAWLAGGGTTLLLLVLLGALSSS